MSAYDRVHIVLDSPIGALTAVRTEAGLCGLYMEITRRPLRPEQTGPRGTDGFDELAEQLAAYFAGERQGFDLPLDLQGTDFQRRVWDLLVAIPYGETRSYLQLAEQIGERNAVRAVGTANASNPVSIIVPCHRVIGSDGSLTGYAGGLERKRFLLDLESRAVEPPLF